MDKYFSRLVLFFLLMALVLIIHTGIGQTASLPLEQRPVAHTPETVQVNESGKAAVFDRGLATFFTIAEGRPGIRLLSEHSIVGGADRAAETLRGMDLVPDYRSFWSGDTLWFYDRELTVQADTTFVFPLIGGGDSVPLEGRVKEIQPFEEYWAVQNTADTVNFITPDTPAVAGDTPELVVEGGLVGALGPEEVVSRDGDTIYVFGFDGPLAERRFPGLIDVEVYDGEVFVFLEEGRVLKLQDRLDSEYIFDLRENVEVNDISIYERGALLAGPEGIFFVDLTVEYEIFYFLTRTIEARKIVGTDPERPQKRQQRRIWLEEQPEDKAGDTTILLVGSSAEAPRAVGRIHDTPPKYRRASLPDDLSLSARQYFFLPESYWSPDGYLYYYFSDDNSLEKYNRENEIISRLELNWEQMDRVKAPELVGVNEEYVILEGQYFFPRQGNQRIVLIFDSDGELKRLLQVSKLVDASRGEGAFEVSLAYGGDGYLYLLFPEFIQQFDLDGFERGFISGVEGAVDLVGHQEGLIVLADEARSIKEISRPQSPPVRLGSPRSGLNLSEGLAIDDRQAYLVGGGPGGRAELFEYNFEERSYEQVMSTPQPAGIFFPYHERSDDDIYFWSRPTGVDKYNLYRTDRARFQSENMGVEAKPRGPGIAQGKVHIFPAVNEEADTLNFRYIDLEADTSGKVENSEGLLHLERVAEDKYYGIYTVDDNYKIIRGELDKSEFVWRPVEELLDVDRRISRLHYDEGDLYLRVEDTRDSSRLVRLRPYRDRYRPETIRRQAGNFEILTLDDEKIKLLNLPLRSEGHLVELYPDNQGGPRGGLRGRLSVADPVDLSGVPFLIQPGGDVVTTESRGYFRKGDLPAGYISLEALYRDYVPQFTFWEVINEGEYGSEHSIPLHSPEDVPLLDRAFELFSKGRLAEAQSRLDVFRGMGAGDVYMRQARQLLKEILFEKGELDVLRGLMREEPGIFTPGERMKLIPGAADRAQLELLEAVKDNFIVSLSPFVKYRLSVLYYEQGQAGQPYLQPPVLGLEGANDK